MVSSMEELEERVRRRVYRMQDLSEQLAAIRVRESAAGGAVTVELDGTGALVNLVLTEQISSLSSKEFEDAVVDAADAAAQRAMARHAELIREFNNEMAE